MTVAMALSQAAARLGAAGVPDPRREARWLLLATGAPDPLLYPESPLAEHGAAFHQAVARRERREPFAYIVGRREFYGIDLTVGPAVLIPRPETEGLVERALELAPLRGWVADLCTGSGAVAVALALRRPDLRVDAADISAPALDVAAANARRHGLEARLRLYRGDLWAALPEAAYALCTCNPPYVEEGQWPALEPEVRDWEPRMALVTSEGWAEIYRRLAAGAMERLAPGGRLVAEIGAGQDAAVADIFSGAGLRRVRVAPDLAGMPRYAEGVRPE